jgi:hypothetical protein
MAVEGENRNIRSIFIFRLSYTVIRLNKVIDDGFQVDKSRR